MHTDLPAEPKSSNALFQGQDHSRSKILCQSNIFACILKLMVCHIRKTARAKVSIVKCSSKCLTLKAPITTAADDKFCDISQF